MSIDPTKLKIDREVVPFWEHEESFQDIMAEQLKHAPWLGLSILIHGIGIFLLIVLMPVETLKKDDNIMQMAPQAKEEKIEEQKPPEEEVKEEVKEEVVIQDTEVQEVTEIEEGDPMADSEVASAFTGTGWNTALGLGGGAGGKFGGRRGGRKGLGGSGKSTAEAIELGLEWLKKHQDEDGKWDADQFMKHDAEGTPCDGPGNPVHDIGLTGLATLAFLGDGSTMRSGPYREVIKKAITWLREQQDPEKGLFGQASSHDFIYDHALASIAMIEAYGLSDYKLLRKNAQLAINYLESHRNPYKAWRYQPRDNENDTSVTAWCVQAYKSAQDFKLEVNSKALEFSGVFLDELTDPTTGALGYTKRGELSSRHPGDHGVRFPPEKTEALTAAGLLTRIFLGQDPQKTPVMMAAANRILTKPPEWKPGGSIDMYYWYYASYALYQIGGRHWNDWSKKMTDAIVKSQRKDANFRGSWDPLCAWGEDGGRVYSTATMVLCLEAYYRYSKIVR